MARTPAIAQGREAFDRRQWKEAYARLSQADRDSPLEPADLERMATAAYQVGEDAHAIAIWTRAHHQFIDRGNVARAARLGFWLSLNLLLAGETARSSGWLARSQRLLKDCDEPCVERGYGLVVTGLAAMGRGDADGAGAAFEQALALAEQFADGDLLALALLGRGESLIRSRNSADGLARLDEAMVTVTAGEVSPVLTGIVYCAVILICQHIFDLRRAREWTAQFDAWCASQPDLVPYRGQCLVHRSEILQLRGDWPEALAEVMQARDHLAGRSDAVVGRACYQQGELHRLRGEFAKADRLYREAGRYGCEPQPGVSLLRLAEGRPDAAAAAIRTVADCAGGPQEEAAEPSEPKLLGPYVEIAVATGELDKARAAAETLARIAAAFDSPFLLAASAQATGTVLLAEGRMNAAHAAVRQAWAIWRQLDMPYESARVQVLIGHICQALDDPESACIHFDAARAVFARLGAEPDLAGVERLMARRGDDSFGALTDRERQVLSLVAAGDTNRQIAAALGISEHTVARHLSNVFDKLGVTTRTAAGALAHRHGLV